jgi:hypothetical protein
VAWYLVKKRYNFTFTVIKIQVYLQGSGDIIITTTTTTTARCHSPEDRDLNRNLLYVQQISRPSADFENNAIVSNYWSADRCRPTVKLMVVGKILE